MSEHTLSPLRRKHLKVGEISTFWKIMIYLLLAALAVVFIVPFLLVISISFSADDSIKLNGYKLIPTKFTLDGYRYIFNNGKLVYYAYRNSIITAGLGTVLNVLMCLLVAYPLAREEFKWRKSVSFFVFFTMMFGGGLVPYYILVKQYLHLNDSLWVLILPALVSPGNVFLLRIFIQSLPKEIYESARMDGANEYTILFKITAPLVKAGIATVSLFIVLGYWNDVFTPRLFITEPELYTLPLLLDRYTVVLNQTIGTTLPGMMAPPKDAMMFAMCVVSTGPMLFVFMFFQKYFVKGMVLGSVKG